MIKFLQDKKNIKKEIELINFSHCKFLIDSNKIDFINDLATELKTYDCKLTFNQIKFIFEISSNDEQKLDKALEFVFSFIYTLEEIRLPKFWKNHF